jgi:drug/metabolite transporter (DMT)-like permease
MYKTKKQKVVVSSFLALIFAEILWGVNTPVIKLGLETVPLPLYLSITILGAALLMVPLAVKNWKPLRRKDYALLAIGAIIAITLGNVALLAGLQKVPSLNASLIGLFSPLLLFMLSVQFLKERMSLKTFLGILIAFAGSAIVIGKPWDIASTNSDVLTGNLLIVLAVFCDVIGTLIAKSVLKRVNVYQVTFITLLVGILPVAVFSIQYLYALSPSHAGKNGFLAMGFNIVAITFANYLFMYGLKHRKAQEVGVFGYVHPIATAVAAWFILAEVPDKKLITGAVLIFIGIYLVEVKLTRNVRLRYRPRKV